MLEFTYGIELVEEDSARTKLVWIFLLLAAGFVGGEASDWPRGLVASLGRLVGSSQYM